MDTLWNIYTWVAVVSFTISLVAVIYLFTRSEFDIRRRKKEAVKWDMEYKEILYQELNRDRLRKALNYEEDEKKED